MSSNLERVVPILQIADFLLVPIQIDLDDRTVGRLQQQLMREIERTRAKAVILDVRMVEVIDSYISYTLSETAAMARLMGCRTILCGIQPPVALTLAQMGVVLEELTVARDLEHALVLASSL
ncbi:MAG: STAS domain-containing protein [Thermanaeromonas sp.]|uniref:STAS domain-containing protein n=1 Tax=Thermanaeromonas sp. TaxID=2003697 RepID=UPI00243A8F9C|nr:STAS domain-containing protein [Thermanaeromonas sp.]MCG0279094.1 STAS domain-containing protein [Thermanaeromonas sp.]